MNDSRQSSLLRSAAALGLVALVGTALLAGVHHLTRERIAEQEKRVVLEQLQQIVNADEYDNDLHTDRFVFSNEPFFPNEQQVVAYRARANGAPVAVILRFSAVNGYNGAIGLLAGIREDGSLSGVRVTSHKETPGLGDAIELAKSDWILAFSGKSLNNPPPDDWAVQRDDGAFDQFTGATITPRAVVEAVRLALEYYALNGDLLFEAPSDTNNIKPGAGGELL